MRSRAVKGVVLLLVAGVAFGGGVLLGSTERARTRVVTATTYAVVNTPREDRQVRAPLPTEIAGAIDPRQVPLWAAVPADANLDTADYVVHPPAQVVVTWDRAYRTGVAVWQLDSRTSAAWHRVYTRESELEVRQFRTSLGDVDGDTRPEILIFADTDGSAGNGTYHLLMSFGADLREVFTKPLSYDEGQILLARDALIVREGVDHYGTAVHCCWRRVKETWLRWNGRRLAVVCRDVHPHGPTAWAPPSRTCRGRA